MKDSHYPNLEFLNIDNLSTFITDMPVLYKYMPLENALSTLKNKKIWLANPATWEDPFEKRFLKATYLTAAGKETVFPFNDNIFATCMTRDSSSEAKWNQFPKGTIGIKFTINTKVLLEQLNNYANNNPTFKVYFGKVEYHKREDIAKKQLSQLTFEDESKGIKIKKILRDKEFCARLFLLKRNDFKYEDEIRIITFNDLKTKSKGIVFDYNCANYQLFPELIISPRVENHTELMLKEYLQQFDMAPYVNKRGISQPRIKKNHLFDDENNVTIKT